MRASRTILQPLLALSLIAAAAATATAQTSTATIRGRVTDSGGEPIGDAEITAVGAETGFVKTVRSRPEGTFLLPGLVPGPYQIVVASPAHEPKTSELTLLVGQTIDVTLRLTPTEVFEEAITVVGNTPVEMKTHQVITNVTEQQIEQLPQNNRNFMNFAELAPGLRTSDDEFRRTFSAGAQSANAVNVFIDGVSFKNDVLQGGIVGQDASRGNPFPQNAVQEFRVLTQNYSAEFQKSSSAVITAVTKSGTNDLEGDVFAFWQDKSFLERDPFAAPGTPKPEYERLQGGFTVGGPIVPDRMHYFVSAENNDQDRVNRVALGSGGTPEFRQQFLRFEGEFVSPFESLLAFGKLSYQPADNQLVDLSGYLRDETDERGFGGQTSFQSAEEVVNDVWQLGGRHQYTAASWLNEVGLSYQDFRWSPRPLNPETVGQNFQGIVRVGGRDTEQDFNQKRISLRDDVTTTALDWGPGDHVFKIGGNVDWLDYEVFKRFAGNPIFEFRQTENYEFPFEARFGLGDPNLSGDNTQFGLYVQDDWTVNDRFVLNVGVRWDYESDMFPTDYETPAEVRADWTDVLRSRFGQGFLDNYFTDGDDRDAIDDMIAPRLGFTWDVTGDAKTIVYGGWGRYYDRVLYNNSLDERFASSTWSACSASAPTARRPRRGSRRWHGTTGS